MKKIKSLKGKRWLIWAIVAIVVVLVGLAVYINYVTGKDAAAVPAFVVPNQAPLISTVKVKTPVTESGAITLVTNLPEVKAYVSSVKANHGSPHIVVLSKLTDPTSQNPYWAVHVYQYQNNKIVTYGWYSVYKNSGRIAKQ